MRAKSDCNRENKFHSYQALEPIGAATNWRDLQSGRGHHSSSAYCPIMMAMVIVIPGKNGLSVYSSRDKVVPLTLS